MHTRRSGLPRPPIASEVVRAILELALRAPSIHNTQPWRWRRIATGVELRADRRYQLVASDPSGRNLLISCGAALHHLQTAALGLGWAPATIRHTEPEQSVGADPDLLATVHFSPVYAGARDAAALQYLRERRTDRRCFTSWPVSPQLLHRLICVAEVSGAEAVRLSEIPERVAIQVLAQQAWIRQESRADAFVEQRLWIDHSTADGIPLRSLRRSRHSAPGFGATGMRVLDDSDVHDPTIVLGGPDDAPDGWLRSGEALSALWLEANAAGLSVVPLSQIIEVDETRRTLQHQILGGNCAPHLLLRIGWLPLGRSDLPRTERRPLDEFLDP